MSWLILIVLSLSISIQTHKFSETSFFEALYSKSLDKIDAVLATMEKKENLDLKMKAFRGTLLMKKSSFMKTPAQKIKVFKEGNKLLEAVIKASPKDILFRFLRLTIQENAPKILRYYSAIASDSNMVINGYKQLTLKQQSFVLDYAKQSVSLRVITQ